MIMPSEEFEQVRGRVNAWCFWTAIYMVFGARANIGYRVCIFTHPELKKRRIHEKKHSSINFRA